MKEMLPKMLNDLFKIVLDPVFAPKTVPESTRPNNFDLIYKESTDALGPPINKRRSFNLDLCYPIPDLKPLIGGRVKRQDSSVVSLMGQPKQDEKTERMIERTNSTIEVLSRSKSIGVNPNYRTHICKKREVSDTSRERANGHFRHGSIDEARQRSSIDDDRI